MNESINKYKDKGGVYIGEEEKNQCSRVVKGGGLKIPCVSFVGSNPTTSTKDVQCNGSTAELSNLQVKVRILVCLYEKKTQKNNEIDKDVQYSGSTTVL